jgi:hypothetical protein
MNRPRPSVHQTPDLSTVLQEALDPGWQSQWNQMETRTAASSPASQPGSPQPAAAGEVPMMMVVTDKAGTLAAGMRLRMRELLRGRQVGFRRIVASYHRSSASNQNS